MTLREYPDRDLAVISVADVLASALRAALSNEKTATLAVPGGTTPGPIFDALAALDLAWERVEIMLTDERWVPEDHARSNTRLVRERLCTDKASAARFVPFYRAGMDAAEAAAALSSEMEARLPISILLLGMGADMHTASLFPGAPGLDAALAADAPALCAVYPDDQPEARITLSARVLRGAMERHLVIFGDDKKEAWLRARSLSAHQAPIGAVMKEGEVHWAA